MKSFSAVIFAVLFCAAVRRNGDPLIFACILLSIGNLCFLYWNVHFGAQVVSAASKLFDQAQDIDTQIQQLSKIIECSYGVFEPLAKEHKELTSGKYYFLHIYKKRAQQLVEDLKRCAKAAQAKKTEWEWHLKEFQNIIGIFLRILFSLLFRRPW